MIKLNYENKNWGAKINTEKFKNLIEFNKLKRLIWRLTDSWGLEKLNINCIKPTSKLRVDWQPVKTELTYLSGIAHYSGLVSLFVSLIV